MLLKTCYSTLLLWHVVKKRILTHLMKYFFDKVQCINKKEKNNMKYVVLNFNALIRRIRRKEKKKKGF